MNSYGMHERPLVRKDSTETIATLAANDELRRLSQERRQAMVARLKRLFLRRGSK